eukprot:gnl/Spiro4/2630_TR1270_c0_g1_i1.p1 gnl/Spiro4/2630_TR1270_c0_g1~~gnl/Spiro4/2630_TR1270_c0_g1_i1.p1  ORF type:complete len:170 (+),score=39.84 gnl/Spiro4/2630_TR1270_c0_g1_i1:45-512(+)
MCNVSPDVATSWADLVNDSTPTNWVLFVYQSPGEVVVAGKGTGGLRELLTQPSLQAERICYAGFRCTAIDNVIGVDGTLYTSSRRQKFVFFTWIGDSVNAMQRGRAGMATNSVKRVCQPLHLDLTVSKAEEIVESSITQQIIANSGAHRPTSVEY